MSIKKILTTSILGLTLLATGAAIAIPNIPTAVAGDNSTKTGDTQREEASLTEANQSVLLKSGAPIPKLKTSLERENLKKRAEFINDANRLGYVYLLSDMGSVISQYTVKGKVSSLNSLLTTPQQIVDDPFASMGDGGQVVDSPDLDGSYGTNPEGIFFFTTEGVYVEWSGKYIYSSEQMDVQTPVSLTRTIK